MNINVIYGQGAAINSAPAGFYTAVNYVISYLDELFTNNVTLNINISYGAILDPYTGGYLRLSSGDLGESYQNNGTTPNYGAVQAALLAENAPGASTLPAVSPISGSLYMGSAEAKALGLEGASAALDGTIGISASTAWDFSPGSTPTANQYYLVGTLEHEITEIMGRVSYLSGGSEYGLADLYRYSAPGVRSDTPGGSGSTAYFSIDNGATNLGTWNNQISNGDLADWYPQGPAPGGNDAFNDFSSSGAMDVFSSADLTLMQALGWSIIPATPSITTLVGQPVNGGTIEVQGTGQAGDTVSLYLGNAIVGGGTVNSNGVFDIVTSATFADGVVSLTASETDGANQTSAVSPKFNVDVDPNAPTLTLALGQALKGGPIEVQGAAEAGDVVTLYQGNTVVGSGTAGSHGTFDITTTASFVNGVIPLTAAQTDSAGLSSAKSALFDVTVGLVEVDQTYETILQRAPITEEVTAGLATDSTFGLSGITASIIDAPEPQHNVYPIAQIVELATGTMPTTGQLAGWVPFVESHGLLQGSAQTNPLLDQMAAAFVASTAFGNTYDGGTAVDPNAPITASIVSAVIKAATGVAATQTQISAWLATGQTIDQVFVDFALGDQYSTHIQAAVQQYLTTVADKAVGGSGLAVVNATPNDGLTAAQVQGAYQAVLERAATSAELIGALSTDATIGNVGAIAALVDGAEAQQHVYPVTQVILLATGDLPTAGQLAGWVPTVESGTSLDNMALAFVASTAFANAYNGGAAVNPEAPITASIASAIIHAATGVAATQSQVDAWVGTGLTIDQVFVDFSLGDQYTTAMQGTVQDYLAAAAINEAGLSTVDGVDATGALVLGTIQTPLTGNGLTVQGGSGSLAVVAGGSNDSINLANGANTVTLTGDLTRATTQNGATASDIAMTTLGNVLNTASDQINFDNAMIEKLAGSAPMDVTAAGTSLAIALDIAASDAAASQAGGQIAAHTGVIDWFQFGGNTYIVEAINGGGSSATHPSLTATDEVVKIVGQVNLTGQSLNGHTLTL